MLLVPSFLSRPTQNSQGCFIKVVAKEKCLGLCLTVVLSDSVRFYPALCPGEKFFCSFSFLLCMFFVFGGMRLELKLNSSSLKQ